MGTGAVRRRITITVHAAVFVYFVGLLGLTPLYAQVARDLRMDAASFGGYFLATGVINVALQIPVGVLADRYGRRPIMVVGLVLLLASQLLRWQAANGLVFLAGQVFMGMCGPFVVSAGYALIADLYTTGRARALGALQGSINVGQGAGYLLAGVLSPALGWRGFSLCLALLPALLLPLAATQPTLPQTNRTASIPRGLVAALGFLAVPAAASLAVIGALNLGAGTGTTYLLPFIASQHHTGPTVTSLLLVPYLLGSIVGGPLAGAWAEKMGVRAPSLALLAAGIAGLIALALVGYHAAVVAACMALVGMAVAGLLAVVAEAVIALAIRRGAGTGAALGGIRIGQGLGPALAPAAAGLLFDTSGPALPYLAMAACLTIAAALMLFAGRPDQERAG
jgi:MFS transporter, DHA1 family, multidrug resistance protein